MSSGVKTLFPRWNCLQNVSKEKWIIFRKPVPYILDLLSATYKMIYIFSEHPRKTVFESAK